MAHYAFLSEQNTVTSVIVGRDEDDLIEGVESWTIYYGERRGKRCLQTSYNTHGGVHYDPATGDPSADQSKAFRGNYAGVGFTYDEALDAFIPPKPEDGEWVLDESTFGWVEVEDEAV